MRPVAEKYDRLMANGLTVENRWGEPDDVGRAVAMLARGELRLCHGQRPENRRRVDAEAIIVLELELTNEQHSRPAFKAPDSFPWL